MSDTLEQRRLTPPEVEVLINLKTLRQKELLSRGEERNQYRQAMRAEIQRAIDLKIDKLPNLEQTFISLRSIYLPEPTNPRQATVDRLKIKIDNSSRHTRRKLLWGTVGLIGIGAVGKIGGSIIGQEVVDRTKPVVDTINSLVGTPKVKLLPPNSLDTPKK